MKLAIHETLLPGRTLAEKFNYARSLGIMGVEFQSHGLTARVPAILDALQQTGMMASGVHMGRRDGFLYPDLADRERAVGEMRQAFADALDIGAAGVTFVPHYGGTKQPDLRPFKAPEEIDYELMVWLLRGVSDLAYAIGVELYMQPVNRYESGFMNRVDQAVHLRRQIKDHPHVKVAVNLFHTALEETDPLDVLKTHMGDVGQVYLSDSNHRLPGQGLLDYGAVISTLRDSGYAGWLTLECGVQQDDALPACVEYLRQMGFRIE